MRHVIGLFLVVAVAPALVGAAEGDPGEQALLGWRAWATGVLEDARAGIQPVPGLVERLRALIADRRTEGTDLSTLESDEGLDKAAEAHAIDLLRRGFMAHENPDGLGPSERVALLARRFGGIVGENIAEHEGLGLEQIEAQVGPLALKIADGFMASPAHRDNILRADYSHEALAAFIQGERLVVVHVFGDRSILLDEPVAFDQPRGGDLALGAASGKRLDGYAYRAHGQPLDELVVLEASSTEIVVDPGLYQLMFLFGGASESSFMVADGPWIEVR